MEENNLEEVSNEQIIKGLILIVVILFIFCFGGYFIYSKTKGNKINIDDIILKEQLISIPDKKGMIIKNNQEEFYSTLYNVDNNTFNQYENEIKSKFNINEKLNANCYEAYNENGYVLNLNYNEKEKTMNINIKYSGKIEDIKWDNELAKRVPPPPILRGTINSITENVFDVTLKKVEKDIYNEYVKTCVTAGFKLEPMELENYYSGKFINGIKIEISYRNDNDMNIKITKEEATDQKIENDINNINITIENSTIESRKGVSNELIVGLKNYEKAVDEYIDFVKKLNDSTKKSEVVGEAERILKNYEKEEANMNAICKKGFTKEEQKYFLQARQRIIGKIQGLAMYINYY